MIPHTVEYPFIRFNGNSGYSRHGDTVSLFADHIDNLNSAGITSGSLALQLWACQAPYNGGSLTGWKLAEFLLGILQANHFLAPVKSDVPANFPESGDYAIVLVIAEWDGDDFNLIHDFQNYPRRDVFLNPRLDGLVGYRCMDDGRLVVEVERIQNPRDPNNTSGTLSLELWALAEPYVVGDFAGYALAGVTLGTLAGGASWQDRAYDLEISPPPAGSYTLVLMLREWTGNCYVTRDHSNFKDRVTFPLVTPPLPSSETVTTNNAHGEVLNAVQSPVAVTVATTAGQETESPLPKDPEQAGAEQESENMFVATLPANIRRFAQWVLEKIKLTRSI
jgi:hypothetical protein